MGATVSNLSHRSSGKALLEASQCGSPSAVQASLATDPQALYFRTLFNHDTPLHAAAAGGHADVVVLLLQQATRTLPTRRAPPPGRRPARPLLDATNERGQTALMLAAEGGHLACLKVLLREGADAWATDRRGGRTALHYAAAANHSVCVRALVELAGPAPARMPWPNPEGTSLLNLCTSCGFSALHHGIYVGAHAAVQELLQLGIALTHRSMYEGLGEIQVCGGSTPLHIAASTGCEAMVRMVLRAGADRGSTEGRLVPDLRLLRDSHGSRPSAVAAKHGHSSLAALLDPSAVLWDVLGLEDLLLGPLSLARLARAALQAGLQTDLARLAPGGDGAWTGAADACARPDTAALDVVAGAAAAAAGGAGASSSSTAGACARAGTSAAEVAADAFAGADVAAAASAASSSGGGDADGDEGQECHICCEAVATAAAQPCRHPLCVGCAHKLFWQHAMPVLCPFCRGPITGFAAAAASAAGAP